MYLDNGASLHTETCATCSTLEQVPCARTYKVKANTMYKTLSTYDIAHALSENKDNGFTRAGALALAEYLEQYEEDTGESIELDTIALRCEYSEYASALEACKGYSFECERDEDEDDEEYEERAEAEALTFLEDRTKVIPFDSGIIILDF